MDQETLNVLQDTLSKNQKIGIIVGKNPKLDEMGAALALYLSLKEISKTVSIASPTSPIVEISSLVGIDKVKTALNSQDGDLIVAFPYKEGEIEKVSYTLENGTLNIIVKSSEKGLSFSQSDVEFKRMGNLPALLFVVGTARISDLGGLFDAEALKETTIVNIDNKKDNQKFGDIVLVSSDFSSVSEQMAKTISLLGLPLNIDASQNLLSGILSATNNFQDQKSSVVAFEMAALLMRKGAVRKLSMHPRKDDFNDTFFSNLAKQQAGFSPKQDKNVQKQTPPPFQRNQPNKPSFQAQQQNQSLQNPSFQAPKDQNASYDQTQKPAQNWPKPNQGGLNQGGRQSTPEEEGGEEAPPDWLAPKVYKSKTFI